MPKKLVSALLAVLLPYVSISILADDLLPTASTVSIEASHLKLTSAEWRLLQDNQIVTRAVTGAGDKELAGFGAMMADASPGEFIAAFESLAVFASSETTLACGRFNAEPSLSDLDKLIIDDRDLYALMHARSNAADIKLSASDLVRIQSAAGFRPLFTSKLKARLMAEYKQLLLDKVRTYLESGEASLGAYIDQEVTVSPQEAFAGMFRAQEKSLRHAPNLFSQLSAQPRQTTSFLYWAQQKFGRLKPVISLIHVLVHREGQRVFIASKQIYSSHYTEAGLGVAELIPFIGANGRPRTLAAYTIRLQVDLLGGSMGFMKKRMAQPHLLETIKTSLTGLRRNVEAPRN